VAVVGEHDAEESAENQRIGVMGLYAAASKPIPDAPATTGPSPFSRASALQELYFPELQAEFDSLRQARGTVAAFRTKEIGLIVASAAGWRTDSQATFANRSSESLRPTWTSCSAITARARRLLREKGLAD
jgi:hypothetical protein